MVMLFQGNHFVVLPGSKMEQIRQNAGNPNLPLNLIVSQASANVATQPFSLEVRFESASFTNREMTGMHPRIGLEKNYLK